LCPFSSLFLFSAYLRIFFPTCGSKQLLSLFFKKGKPSSVGNDRPIAILNNIFKVLKFIIHDYVSHLSKSKLNSSQHGFIKSESNVTNLVTFLDFVTPIVCLQGQTDLVYFDSSNAFDILPHALLHHKLSSYWRVSSSGI
jgi:hypothetical protein